MEEIKTLLRQKLQRMESSTDHRRILRKEDEMRETFTDTQVEAEISRLLASDDVKLAKAEQRIKNRRRQYMYQLRTLERRGKELSEQGYTVENIEMMFGEEYE